MPGTSQRELRNLGKNADKSSAEVLTMSNAAGTTPTASFTINPCASDVNPSTESGSKLCLKATEKVSAKDKINLSISNGTKVSEALKKCRSKYAWGLLLSKVCNDDGNEQDVLKNHRALALNNTLAFSNTHLGKLTLKLY